MAGFPTQFLQAPADLWIVLIRATEVTAFIRPKAERSAVSEAGLRHEHLGAVDEPRKLGRCRIRRRNTCKFANAPGVENHDNSRQTSWLPN